ncbi:MAG TPA: I78 family peptidase inhibitor [Allosphingosinicella sp.]|nr:I78 family peptidase inhibitor [Allosphingosinicella sp.]
MRALVAAALLAGCATPAPEPEGQTVEHGAGECDATRVQDLIGRQRSEAVGAEAIRRSKAQYVRWIAPDSMITQDLREDRINIDVDARGRITGLRCF